MTNSILKVPIVTYIAKLYWFICLLNNRRDIHRENKYFELKPTVVINDAVSPRDVECWCKLI